MFRLKLPSLVLNDAVINLDEKGDFEDSFEMYYKTVKKRTKFLKITRSWDSFGKQYSNISPEKLKQTLIVSHMNDKTEAFLSNLRISDNREYCVQLMSIPEYQLC